MMASHVANRSGSKLSPAPPIEWMQALVVFPKRSRTQPFIPMQIRRHRLALRPTAASAKVPSQNRVTLDHIANGASSDVFGHSPDAIVAVSLVTHLRAHFLFFGRAHQDVTLANIM